MIYSEQFQMINKGDKKSKSLQKFEKSSCSLKSLNIYERINNYQSLEYHRKIMRTPVKICPFHFMNNLPNPRYMKRNLGGNNKQHQHQTYQSSKSRQNSRDNQNLYRKEIKPKTRNLDSYYNKNERCEIKKTKQFNNGMNRWDGIKKREKRQKQSEYSQQINKGTKIQKINCSQQQNSHVKNIKTETSIVENNSSSLNLVVNSQNFLSKQADQTETKLSISALPSQIISESSLPKFLQYQSVVNVKIQNNQQRIKRAQENNCLRDELQHYKNQCKMLEQQLRTTLETVKSMASQLQSIKVESKISSSSNLNYSTIGKQAYYADKAKVQSAKNQYQGSPGLQNHKFYVKTQEVHQQPEKQKNVENVSTNVIRTISPTIISSGSCRIIRIGRDRNYCVKGCVNICNCLCPSFSNQLPS